MSVEGGGCFMFCTTLKSDMTLSELITQKVIDYHTTHQSDRQLSIGQHILQQSDRQESTVY